MALTGKQIADAVVASARSSGYFKTYATPNWKDFYDRVATKLTAETSANNDFNVISGHVLTLCNKNSMTLYTRRGAEFINHDRI